MNTFSSCVQERRCSWTTTSGSQQPQAGPTKQSLWGQPQGRLSSPCISPWVSGSPRQQGRTLGTTEHPSLHGFSRNSSSVLPLRVGQESLAAPAAARVAWWLVRDSKAKIQPLQLLWLSHLLNYAGKCAWNHNLHWFSSPLPETKANWARGNHSS